MFTSPIFVDVEASCITARSGPIEMPEGCWPHIAGASLGRFRRGEAT